MKLPCRHIFLSRSEAKCELFVEELCDQRWSKCYYQSTQWLFTQRSREIGPSDLSISTSTKRSLSKLNHNERYSKALLICKSLSSLAAETGGETFASRLKTLACLQEIWEKGEEARIVSNSIGMILYLFYLEQTI